MLRIVFCCVLLLAMASAGLAQERDLVLEPELPAVIECELDLQMRPGSERQGWVEVKIVLALLEAGELEVLITAPDQVVVQAQVRHIGLQRLKLHIGGASLVSPPVESIPEPSPPAVEPVVEALEVGKDE